jgi:hypothetical protein
MTVQNRRTIANDNTEDLQTEHKLLQITGNINTGSRSRRRIFTLKPGQQFPQNSEDLS